MTFTARTYLSCAWWSFTCMYVDMNTSSHLMVDSSVQLGLNYSYHMPLVSSHQQWGQTPVYIASVLGHGAVVQMLIEAKADINHPKKVWDEYCNHLLYGYVCVVYTSLEWREEEEVLQDEEGVKDEGNQKGEEAVLKFPCLLDMSMIGCYFWLKEWKMERRKLSSYLYAAMDAMHYVHVHIWIRRCACWGSVCVICV